MSVTKRLTATYEIKGDGDEAMKVLFEHARKIEKEFNKELESLGIKFEFVGMSDEETGEEIKEKK